MPTPDGLAPYEFVIKGIPGAPSPGIKPGTNKGEAYGFAKPNVFKFE